MRKIAVLAAILGLSACAPSLQGGNEAGGIFSQVTNFNRAEAFTAAEAHCKQFGKAARISGTDALYNTMTFDCVAP